MKPYTEQVIGVVSYRTFAADTDEMELIWHRDAEDRWIEAHHTTDWLFQFDNELPIPFDRVIHIPKEAVHRVIKGTGDLRLRIIRYTNN